MLSLLCPHWVFEDYTAVTPEFLRERGVRLLLCDLDYTLAPKRQKEPDEPLKAWIGALRASGVPDTATAMQAIGYKEFFGYLNGACTLEEAAALCKQRSRNYAKRQLTWFRRNPDIRWLRLTGAEDFSEVLSAARQNVPFSAL